MQKGAIVLGAIMLWAAGSPAYGYLNNGWQTDYYWSCTAAGGVVGFRDSDGASQGQLIPSGNGVYSLVFTGTGTNDARMYTMAPNSSWTDVEIRGWSAAGVEIRAAMLSDLVGSTAECEWENIRYNPVRNSLFIGRDNGTNHTDPVKVYEIDLNLTTLLATYTGPVVSSLNEAAQSLAINPQNGMLYVMSRGMGSGSASKGDVIAFDTSGGSTSTYTTVIDGDTQGSEWFWPESILFRSGVTANGNQNTILVMFENDDTMYSAAREYRLDGTLLKTHTGLLGAAYRRPFNGVQDRLTGDVWIGSVDEGHYRLSASNDAVTHVNGTATYYDVASPGASAPTQPLIVLSVSAFSRTVQVGNNLSSDTFTVRNGGTGTINYTISDNAAWLSCAPASGSSTGEADTITISYSTSGLSIGTYTGTITVTDAGAGNSPQTITVNLYVSSGTVNNGWFTDYYWSAYERGVAGGRGSTWSFRDLDGVEQAELLPAGTNVWSLVFTGTGSNDARLFTAIPNGDFDDVELYEWSVDGDQLQFEMLSDIVGGTVASEWENIRYNPLRNTLLIAMDDRSEHTTPIRVFEIDLNLSTLVATYTGPVVASINDASPCIAINPANGMLYVMSRGLGSSSPSKGDVIAFNTSGGSTSTYTTVIDGDTQGSQWFWPESIIFRSGVPANSNQNTLLVLFENEDSMYSPTQEYLLNGTLLKTHTGLLGAAYRRPYNGIQDRVTGDVWIGSIGYGHWRLSAANDAVASFNSGVYYDIACPGVPAAAQPMIALDPASFDRSVAQGGNVPSDTFTVTNSGDGTLNYTISDNVTWLSCAPASGSSTGESDTITITYSTSGLAVGTYNATITVTDSGASNSPQTIAVTVHITSTTPAIALSPTSFTRTVEEGSNLANDTFTVRNSSGGTLNYTITDNVAWLACAPASGSSMGEEDTITITYNTSGLATGTYSATITVTDSAASNSPQTIPVSLSVIADMWDNGWRTDFFWSPYEKGTGMGRGSTWSFSDVDGLEQTELLPSGTNIHSLTFAGSGQDNARLYTMYIVPAGNDVEISEWNAAGGEVRYVLLSSLIGSTVPCSWENIRYNPVRNTLFIGVDNSSNTTAPIKVYEINLELNLLVATYTGPVVTSISSGAVCVAINPKTGMCYVLCRGMGTTDQSKGDVIAFDTSSGSTSSYVTVIDGDTQGTQWFWPESIVFRSGVPANGNQDTLLVFFENDDAMYSATREYRLNGSLLKTHNGLLGAAYRQPFNGSQDRITGDVYLGSIGYGQWRLSAVNDAVTQFNSGICYDAACPGNTYTSPEYAEISIDIGANEPAYGLTRTVPEVADGNTVVADMGGVSCRRTAYPTGAPDGVNDLYMYFKVDDTFAFQGGKPDLYITIKYWDGAGSTPIRLQYDSLSAYYKEGGTVALTGSNTWKTHTFHVTDAYFGNRQNSGSDFRIHKYDLELYLDTVKVSTQSPPAPPYAQVSVNLGPTDGTYGVLRPIPEVSDGNTIADLMGGVWGRRTDWPLNAPDGYNDYHIYFKVDDSFAYQGNRQEVWIKVKYFDAWGGTVPLLLQYDSTSGAYTLVSATISMSESFQWKTFTFHLTDAYFGNRQNGGADFRILRTSGYVSLDTVAVSGQEPPQ